MKKSFVLLFIILSASLLACNNTEKIVEETTEKVVEQVNSIDALGVVEAKKQTSLTLDFNARVLNLKVSEGEGINRETVLVKFDLSDYENELSEKRLDLAYYQSKLGQANYDSVQKSHELSLSKEALRRAEETLRANEILINSGAISQNEYDASKAQVNTQKTNVTNLELSIKSSNQSVNNNDMETQHQVEKLLNEINTLETKYKRSKLVDMEMYSPYENGVVEKINIKEGDYINRESSIMTVIDLDSRIVKANVAEEFVHEINIGQSVEIITHANEDKIYHGTIINIWDLSTKKGGETIVPIEIEIKDIDDELYINFNVDVKILLEEN